MEIDEIFYEPKDEIGTNMQQSFDALKQLQQEKNLSDEDVTALVNKLFGETDENGKQTDLGIIGNAVMGIVSKDVWEAVLNTLNKQNQKNYGKI